MAFAVFDFHQLIHFGFGVSSALFNFTFQHFVVGDMGVFVEGADNALDPKRG